MELILSRPHPRGLVGDLVSQAYNVTTRAFLLVANASRNSGVGEVFVPRGVGGAVSVTGKAGKLLNITTWPDGSRSVYVNVSAGGGTSGANYSVAIAASAAGWRSGDAEAGQGAGEGTMSGGSSEMSGGSSGGGDGLGSGRDGGGAQGSISPLLARRLSPKRRGDIRSVGANLHTTLTSTGGGTDGKQAVPAASDSALLTLPAHVLARVVAGCDSVATALVDAAAATTPDQALAAWMQAMRSVRGVALLMGLQWPDSAAG